MNERIQQLADEARLITVNGQTRYALADEFEQRFAELIVAECCEVLSKEDIRHSGYGYNLYGLYQQIQNHFGIEK
jgi:hypothetical protein